MIERLTVGPIAENAYIVPDGRGHCLVIDPGDDASRILSFLDSRSLQPSCVVATHGHLDHTGALPDLVAAWAGRGLSVPIAAHSDDAVYFGAEGEKTNRELFAAIRALSYFRNYWRPIPSPTILLKDGNAIPGTPFVVMHTPGHTRGSICLYDEGSALLISGDTLFQDGVGRTDGPDSDPGLLRESLARLFLLPPETSVFPGHGEPTSIGRERGAK